MIFFSFNTGSYKGCGSIATEIPVVGGQVLKFVRSLIISSFSTDCIGFLALIQGYILKFVRSQIISGFSTDCIGYLALIKGYILKVVRSLIISSLSTGCIRFIALIKGYILKFVRSLIINSFSTDCIGILALIEGGPTQCEIGYFSMGAQEAERTTIPYLLSNHRRKRHLQRPTCG